MIGMAVKMILTMTAIGVAPDISLNKGDRGSETYGGRGGGGGEEGGGGGRRGRGVGVGGSCIPVFT